MKHSPRKKQKAFIRRRNGWGSLATWCAVVFLLLPARGVAAQGEAASPVKVDVVAEMNSLQPGLPFWVGLRFSLEQGWHIYWRNPGDSGQPPSAKWELPAGFQAAEIQWPAPVRLGSGSVVDFGYDKDVLLMIRITPPATLKPGTRVDLGANVSWLMCREICVPGKKRVTLSLPVVAAGRRSASRERGLFIKTRARLPKPMPRTWRVSATAEKDQFDLSVLTGARVAAAHFFPLDAGQIENSAPQAVKPLERGFRLSLRKSDQLLKLPKVLRGILVLGPRAFEMAVPVNPEN